MDTNIFSFPDMNVINKPKLKFIALNLIINTIGDINNTDLDYIISASKKVYNYLVEDFDIHDETPIDYNKAMLDIFKNLNSIRNIDTPISSNTNINIDSIKDKVISLGAHVDVMNKDGRILTEDKVIIKDIIANIMNELNKI